MSKRHATRLLVALMAAVAMAVALIAVLRAYQNPANVVQWLSLLQLCR
jgi:hypothetical protein